MLKTITKFLARNRRHWLVRRINLWIYILYRGSENLNYDFETNGEAWVLHRITKALSIDTAIDVGANQGDWSKIARVRFPTARIHAFEIIPDTFDRLTKSLENDSLTRINNIGLSDCRGELEMFFDPSKHPVATSVPGFSESFHGYKPHSKSLPVMTGDGYCIENEISHINFLKIDVEGHESKVLKGFEKLFQSEKIDIVQFEYGYINIDTGFLLKHFYEYLEPYNMVIGKIYPNYVDFNNWTHLKEDFIGPNYLAVNKCHSNLIEILANKK